MKTMKIYGYSGDEKTLAKELTRGVSIRNITHTGNGGLLVEYEEKKVGGRPKRDDSAQIAMLRSGGMSYSQIADIVGCSKSHAQNVCRTINGNPDFKVFHGKNVDIRPHDLKDGTYMLCKAGTQEALLIGTYEQILQKYDEMNK